MGNWCVNENLSGDGFREFELVYQENFETLAKRFVRVWKDGRVEVGVRNSPFAARWSEQVLADETEVLRRMGRMAERLRKP